MRLRVTVISALLLVLSYGICAQTQEQWLIPDARNVDEISLDRPNILFPAEIEAALKQYAAGDYRLALLSLERTRSLALPDGSLDFVTFVLAESYRKLSLRFEAQKAYEDIVAKFKDSDKIPPSYFRILQFAVEDTNSSLADSLYQIFQNKLRMHPLYSSAVYETALLYFKKKKYAECAEMLLVVPPSSVRYFQSQFLSSLCFIQLKNYDKALLALNYIRKATPDPHMLNEANCIMGDVYFQQENMTTAFAYYSIVDKKSLRYSYALIKIARIALEQKKYAKAKDLSLTFVKRFPKSDYVFEMLSILEQAYTHLGDTSNAAKVSAQVYRQVDNAKTSFDIYSELEKSGALIRGWKKFELAALRNADTNAVKDARVNAARSRDLERQLWTLQYVVGAKSEDTAHNQQSDLAAHRFLSNVAEITANVSDTLDVAIKLLDSLKMRAKVNPSDTFLAKRLFIAAVSADSLMLRRNRLQRQYAVVERECLGGDPRRLRMGEDGPAKYVDWAFMKYTAKKAELASLTREMRTKTTAKNAKDSHALSKKPSAASKALMHDKIVQDIYLYRQQLVDHIITMTGFYPKNRFMSAILFRLAELYYDEAAEKFDAELMIYEKRIAKGDTAGVVFPEYDLSKSLVLYSRISKDFPQDENADDALYYEALGQMKTGDPDGANATMRSLTKSYPESEYFVEANMAIGRYYFEHPKVDSGKGYAKAEDAFRQVLYFRDHPQFVQALYNLGWCYYMQDQYDEAIAVFKYLVEEVELDFDPNKMDEKQVVNPLLRGEAIDYIAVSFDEEEKIDDAVKFLDLIGNPDYAALVLKRIGELREEVSDFTVAYKAYARLLNEYPNATSAPDAMASIIKMFGAQNKLDSALAWRERFFKTYARNSNWWESTYQRDSTLLGRIDSMAIANGLFVADAFFRAAEKAGSKHDYDNAVRNYEMVVSRYPEHPSAIDAQWNLALLSDQKLSNKEFAYSHYIVYSKIVKADSAKREQAALNAIAIAAGLQSPDSLAVAGVLDTTVLRSIDAINNYLTLFPKGKAASDVLVSMGAIYFNRSMFANAIKTYQQVVALWPQTDNAYKSLLLIGQACFSQKNWTVAATSFSEVWKKSPDPTLRSEAYKLLLRSRYNSAMQIVASGDHATAAKELVAIEDQFPQSEYGDIVLFGAAEEFEKDTLYRDAAKTYYRLYGSYPKSKYAPDALFNAAADYDHIKQYERAAESYEIIGSNYPTSDKARDALFNLGLCYEKMGKLDKMAEANERYTLKYPGEKDAKAMFLRSAAFYFKAAMYEKAENVYQNFIRRFPSDPNAVEALAQIGRIRLAQTNSTEAIAYFEQAEQLNQKFALAGKETNNYSASEAALGSAEIKRKEFEALKFSKPGKKLLEDQTLKSELLASASKAYTRAAQYQTEKMFEATFRIGQLYETFADDLSAQKREDLDPIKTAVLERNIDQQASGLLQKSVAPYKKLLELALTLDSLGPEPQRFVKDAKNAILKNYLRAGDLLISVVGVMYKAPIPAEIKAKPLFYFQYLKQLNQAVEPAKIAARDFYKTAAHDLKSLNLDTITYSKCIDKFAQVSFLIGNDYQKIAERILTNDFDTPANLSTNDKEDLTFQLEDIVYEMQDKAIPLLESALKEIELEGASKSTWHAKTIESLARLSPEKFGKSFYQAVTIVSDETWPVRADTTAGWAQPQPPLDGAWLDPHVIARGPSAGYRTLKPLQIWYVDTLSDTAYFRKDFYFDAAPRDAAIFFSCAGKYRLMINGTLTMSDTVGGRSFSKVDSLTGISSLFKGGDNSICISAHLDDTLPRGISCGLMVLVDTTQHFKSLVNAPVLQGRATNKAVIQTIIDSTKGATAGRKAHVDLLGNTKKPGKSLLKAIGLVKDTAKVGSEAWYESQYKNRGELLNATADYAQRSLDTEKDIKKERLALQKLQIKNDSVDKSIDEVKAEIESLKKEYLNLDRKK